MNQEKRTQKTRNMAMLQKIGGMIFANVADKVIGKIISEISNEIGKRQRENTRKDQESMITKDLESKMGKSLPDLKNKMEALKEDFKKLQEYIEYEVPLMRAELTNNQGMKEEGDIAWALELRLKKMVRQLSRSIQTLEEDVQEWPEATKYELLLLSAKLEKSPGMKEGDVAWAQEFWLKKMVRQLSQRIETVEEDVQECAEATKYELQLLRVKLEKSLRKEGGVKCMSPGMQHGDRLNLLSLIHCFLCFLGLISNYDGQKTL